jgi:hypothetical protein
MHIICIHIYIAGDAGWRRYGNGRRRDGWRRDGWPRWRRY